jgi:Putative Ig domain
MVQSFMVAASKGGNPPARGIGNLSCILTLCLAVLMAGCGGGGSSNHTTPLSVTTSSLPQGVVNANYNASLSAMGGATPYAWSLTSGTLPAGLTLSREGLISGAPPASGNSNFTVTVTDSQHPPSVATADLTISVNPALLVTTSSLPATSPNLFYSATLAASGGLPAYTWTITQGSLPAGLTLNATSGLISGTTTATGTSTFTVQVADNETPPATATAALSITVGSPPPHSAALYSALALNYSPFGFGIQSDGSLTMLSSSPETAINAFNLSSSPTLPLLFMYRTPNIESLLVNPDYSVSSATSAALPQAGTYGRTSLDPAGSHLYLPGAIDAGGTAGVNVFPANGSFDVASTIAVPGIAESSQLVFTPDGTQAFLATCPSTGPGSIVSFSHKDDGSLTQTAVYTLSATPCAVLTNLAVSADGKFLATPEVQIYNIASDGTLTPVLAQAFTVLYSDQMPVKVGDVLWDSTGSYLVVATDGARTGYTVGGMAVLTFAGDALTESVQPLGPPIYRLQQVKSFIYGVATCPGGIGCTTSGVQGYLFQNGQLTSLPGSPYGHGTYPDMAVY